MKGWSKRGLAVICTAVLMVGCGKQTDQNVTESIERGTEQTQETEGTQNNGSGSPKKVFEGASVIELSNEGIIVDGKAAGEDKESAVYVDRDIIYYEDGKDFTYGEGTKADEHSEEEADEHVVVHITKAGTYALSGSLSAGQIAVDLGEDAKEDPEAVVHLILNGVDINCSVAPAVIFYNVYECGDTDPEKASAAVDTSGAGANVWIADGTENNISGSYVARIYKSYELNAAGTEVIDSKKLHKYDGAFYSKMSMNINGDDQGDGILNITAENEGLDSELHLTINGGNINILSGNDGINTNEDEVSVTTINGGTLNIRVSGETGEGDGIDSNGWLVINGGLVTAQACSTSGDAGIDSDMGIHINGGTVIASGNMLDYISESEQTYVVFSFDSRQKGGGEYTLKNAAGEAVVLAEADNDFTYLILSSPDLTPGTYTLWNGSTQLAASKGVAMGGFGGMGMMGDRNGMSDPFSQGMTPPEGMELPEGQNPFGGKEWPAGSDMDGVNPTEAEKIDKGFVIPEPAEGAGGEKPKGPEGAQNQSPEGAEGGKGDWSARPGRPDMPGSFGNSSESAEVSTELEITEGGNYFNNVR